MEEKRSSLITLFFSYICKQQFFYISQWVKRLCQFKQHKSVGYRGLWGDLFYKLFFFFIISESVSITLKTGVYIYIKYIIHLLILWNCLAAHESK